MATAERGFLDVLKDLNEGETVTELDGALTKLLGEIRGSSKGGSLVLTLKFKPTGKGAQVEISDEVTIKPPKPLSGKTVMFVTDSNVLTRKDPRQPELAGLRRPAPVERIDRKSETAHE